jgi:dienelactone hydrolase
MSIDRFNQLPTSLAAHARTLRLATPSSPAPLGVPALLIHPNFIDPAPTVLWMHGRTAHKALDPGRFARWLKLGIAAVSIDLPHHGDRASASAIASADDAHTTLPIMRQALGELDHILEALADPILQNVFDLDRLAIGGMSLGGMITLRHLCTWNNSPPHPFRAAAIECTTGDLKSLYDPATGTHPWGISYPPDIIHPLDPAQHLVGFTPLPLLALHSEADRIVPWPVQERFLQSLKDHYVRRGARLELIETVTWPNTGAPEEHSGFGRVSNDAKNIQAEFLARHLMPSR